MVLEWVVVILGVIAGVEYYNVREALMKKWKQETLLAEQKTLLTERKNAEYENKIMKRIWDK